MKNVSADEARSLFHVLFEVLFYTTMFPHEQWPSKFSVIFLDNSELSLKDILWYCSYKCTTGNCCRKFICCMFSFPTYSLCTFE